MESLSATLVHENSRQRFYKLSKPLTKAPNQKYDFETEKEYNVGRLKDQYKKYHTNAIEYVCISDAHTHIERLMFLAIPLNEDNTEFGCMAGLQMDGRHTFMTEGGDQRTVHPDQVYLRRLAKANGLCFHNDKECA